jgi:hypothetical protein
MTDTKKESKIKSFFEHIGEWFKDHEETEQTVEHQASIALAVTSPLLNTLLTVVAGEPIAAKVSALVGVVQTKLANAQALLNGAEAGDPSHSLAGFLTDVQENLGTLLTDVDIKNSTKAAQITSIANTLIGEVEAIQTATANHVAPVVGAATAPAAA